MSFNTQSFNTHVCCVKQIGVWFECQLLIIQTEDLTESLSVGTRPRAERQTPAAFTDSITRLNRHVFSRLGHLECLVADPFCELVLLFLSKGEQGEYQWPITKMSVVCVCVGGHSSPQPL